MCVFYYPLYPKPQKYDGILIPGVSRLLQTPRCEPPAPSEAPLSFTHVWIHHQPVGLGH